MAEITELYPSLNEIADLCEQILTLGKTLTNRLEEYK